jgi:hypothetical protein
MADNVTGSIGSSSVLLENAATEATLQLLLKATLATTSEQKKAINDLVQKAGMDPAKVEEANRGLSTLGQTAVITGGIFAGLNSASDTLKKGFNAFAGVAEQLTDNQGKASVIFGQFAGMGGVIGLVATGMQKIAGFQEQQLATYQQLTQNGINFSGSLTTMRQSASSMYLTMDEFTNLMKNNSQSFAKMGGTADEGAKAFTKVSTDMMKGPLGKNLQALGYTAEQVNQGLASYIEMTGGRNAEEMRNTKALTESAHAYMTELDALAQITGKSKEEQLNAAKEAAANQAYQSKLMTMTEEEKAKAEIARAQAFASGGKGAQEAFMSAMVGLPPMTKAAREYTAIASDMNAVTMKSVDAVKDNTKSVEDMKAINNEYGPAAIKVKEAFGTAGDAIMMRGDGMANTFSTVTATANRTSQQGVKTAEDAAKQRAEIEKKNKERAESEAATAVATQRAVMEMGQEILKILLPAFRAMQPIILKIAEAFASTLKYLTNTPAALNAVIIALGALAVGFTAFKAKQGYDAVKTTFGGAGAGAGGGKGAGGALSGLAGGEGAGKALKGISGGLKSFANPKILVGATIFGAAITIIGAGIAGAAWILGKALPTFAEGLQAFDELDGENLKDVGLGVVQLGAGLIAFGAGGAIAGVGGVMGGLAEGFGKLFGVKSPIEKMMEFAKLGPELKLAGDGIASFNTSLASLLKTDSASIKNLSGNLTNLAGSLKELREASKPVEKSFLTSAADALKSALTPETTKAPPEGTAGAKVANKTDADKKASAKTTTVADVQESLRNEVAKLNSTSMELLRAMRESAENTKKTASILASRGNLLRG